MVDPSSFGFDEQTAKTNTFQHHLELAPKAITRKAQDEFRAYVDMLREHGITVHVFRDRMDPPKPNGVFPNNWLTTWPDGKVFLYPMATPSRRVERSPIALLELADGFEVSEIIDLSTHEQDDEILESTGVMVFDHPNKVAYGCISPRCNEDLFRQHVASLGYKPVTFHAYADGAAIYHTNVLMGVQSKTAVICTQAIIDETERNEVTETLRLTGHEIVDISFAQMEHFCGNVLEVKNDQNELFLIMSQAAYDAFTLGQRATLSQDKTILPAAIPTIETIGGGSARCMLAEVFLPKKPAPQED